jgi:hypothetical protein
MWRCHCHQHTLLLLLLLLLMWLMWLFHVPSTEAAHGAARLRMGLNPGFLPGRGKLALQPWP